MHTERLQIQRVAWVRLKTLPGAGAMQRQREVSRARGVQQERAPVQSDVRKTADVQEVGL